MRSQFLSTNLQVMNNNTIFFFTNKKIQSQPISDFTTPQKFYKKNEYVLFLSTLKRTFQTYLYLTSHSSPLIRIANVSLQITPRGWVDS